MRLMRVVRMKALSQEQVDRYRYDGFLFPCPALAPAEVGEALAGLARLEAWLGTPLTKADMKWRSATYTYLDWANRLVRNPAVLDIVEDVIGPNILVYTSTFFIKEPGSPTFAAWHQDSTYFGLTPHDHVTAWIALTEAGSQAGCMDVLSARGKPRQMHHKALKLANSINGGGQSIVEPVDETGAVAMELSSGSLSLHHTLCAHRSAPNQAAHRRIGYGVSYIPTHCRMTGTYRMPAMLVRGEDKYGNFDLFEPPPGELTEAGIALHDRVVKRYRESYWEQAEMHDRQFATA